MLCQCGCGQEAPIASKTNMRQGYIKGEPHRFIRGHQMFRHRMTNTSEYDTWAQMIHRCYGVNGKFYPDYGGRGITVCQRWRDSFEEFFSDMGLRPQGMSIERMDNDGNYEPNNCKWATATEQQNNRRINRKVEFAGLSLTLSQWAVRTGIQRATLFQRLKHGWSIEDTLTRKLI